MDFECIICLDEITTTELLLLECCNQPAHLKCIKNWDLHKKIIRHFVITFMVDKF